MPMPPIQLAVTAWTDTITPPNTQNQQQWRDTLLKDLPKRFIIYEPMLLLPCGSFTSLPWTTELERHDDDVRGALWAMILDGQSKCVKGRLTHLAINKGIPSHETDHLNENILRSPRGLRVLHGDFGPGVLDKPPSGDDLNRTFWVSKKQNGIHQTWAPRWTMFSRGNVKEKARLLAFDHPAKTYPDSAPSADVWAVDLYAGIGYFAFSYASMGMRVLCWELNPWSVEGLRRGAQANRWGVRVVQGEDLQRPTAELVGGDVRLVVFLEDNQQAARRVAELRAAGVVEHIRHVNCGFLPTSEPSWRPAWELTRPSDEAWLHLHENVGTDDVEARKREIGGMFESWSSEDGDGRVVDARHVEYVKTFAPGVWHCVFDLLITGPEYGHDLDTK